MSDHYSIIDALYDPNNETLEFVEIPVTVSTLVADLLEQAGRRANLSVTTLLNASILRVLHDVDINIKAQNDK